MLLYHFVLKLLKQQVKNMIISSNSGKHSLVPQRQITQDFLTTISNILRIQCIWLSCLVEALIAWMFG